MHGGAFALHVYLDLLGVSTSGQARTVGARRASLARQGLSRVSLGRGRPG